MISKEKFIKILKNIILFGKALFNYLDFWTDILFIINLHEINLQKASLVYKIFYISIWIILLILERI